MPATPRARRYARRVGAAPPIGVRQTLRVSGVGSGAASRGLRSRSGDPRRAERGGEPAERLGPLRAGSPSGWLTSGSKVRDGAPARCPPYGDKQPAPLLYVAPGSAGTHFGGRAPGAGGDPRPLGLDGPLRQPPPQRRNMTSTTRSTCPPPSATCQPRPGSAQAGRMSCMPQPPPPARDDYGYPLRNPRTDAASSLQTSTGRPIRVRIGDGLGGGEGYAIIPIVQRSAWHVRVSWMSVWRASGASLRACWSRRPGAPELFRGEVNIMPNTDGRAWRVTPCGLAVDDR
ncbi:hypothetical protein SAMN04487847_0846 [Microbacterium sp. cf332]|nr:hypothetical protein SAMN04487847_0846 [Microbacterium sp. cf332]